MKVSIDETMWLEPRFLRLCQALKYGRITGVGTLVIFWHATRDRKFVRGTRAQLLHCLPWPASGDLLDALIAHDYVSVKDDGTVEVLGNAESMQLRAKRAAAGKRGQGVKAGSDAKRKDRAAKRRAARAAAKEAVAATPAKPAAVPAKRQASAPKKSTPNQDANRAAWEAYNTAYHLRWGVGPVRNARTNALIAQFVQRVGKDLSPQVLGFFVRHNERAYLLSHHALTLAVRDAEGLATQFHRDTPITTRDVMRFEEAQTPDDQMARIQRGEL